MRAEGEYFCPSKSCPVIETWLIIHVLFQYLEGMQLKYNQKAKDAGVYVVGGLGYVSAPAEVGVQYTAQKFPGLLTEIECFVRSEDGGAAVSYFVKQKNSTVQSKWLHCNSDLCIDTNLSRGVSLICILQL